jgi:hypothetical protein
MRGTPSRPPVGDPHDEEDTMTDNDSRAQVEDGTGYADPGAQTGLSTGEPTDDLHVATGYADHGTQVVLGTREPTDDVHEQAREAAESSEG